MQVVVVAEPKVELEVQQVTAAVVKVLAVAKAVQFTQVNQALLTLVVALAALMYTKTLGLVVQELSFFAPLEPTLQLQQQVHQLVL